jgi:hypothetical protein
METATEAERPSIRGVWTQMLQKMGTHDIDGFLRARWVSRYGDLKDELFDALKDHIEKNRVNSLVFAKECLDECDDYMALMMADESEIPKEALHFVRALTRELSFKPAIPLLLSSYLVLPTKEFAKVAQYMLVFITRYSIIENKSSSGMEDLLFRLAREVRGMVKDKDDKGACAQALKHVKESLANSTPDDKATKKAVVEVILDNSDAKYMMTRLARHMQDPTKSVVPNIEETNLEHVYPQNPEPNEWGGQANQEKLEPLTWNIGNLTIFGKRANRKVANAEFLVKQPRYALSKVEMTKDIASTYTQWDESTIKARAERLAKLVLEIWNFDNTSRV